MNMRAYYGPLKDLGLTTEEIREVQKNVSGDMDHVVGDGRRALSHGEMMEAIASVKAGDRIVVVDAGIAEMFGRNPPEPGHAQGKVATPQFVM